jgi:nitrite reductase/ring-hydroxylating ferredoxin subunit
MAQDDVQWHAVAKLSELEAEEPKHANVQNRPLCVVKLDDGVYCIHDVCTHEFAVLSEGFVDGGEIECPLHQATFDLKTGKCTGPPADLDVDTYPVKIDGDDVYIGLPQDG